MNRVLVPLAVLVLLVLIVVGGTFYQVDEIEQVIRGPYQPEETGFRKPDHFEEFLPFLQRVQLGDLSLDGRAQHQ